MCVFNDRLAFLKPLERVAHCLWPISTGAFSVRRTTAPEGSRQVTQYELSSMRSRSRQCANRALESPEPQGVIAISYKRMVIHDLEKRRAFGESGTW